MLISIASGVGLQNKIYQKVSAFNGDIIISNFDTNFSDDEILFLYSFAETIRLAIKYSKFTDKL